MDMSGQVVLPGYIDAHAHWAGTPPLLFLLLQVGRVAAADSTMVLWGGAGAGNIFPKQSWEFLANLAFGVTTLHNPSADTPYHQLATISRNPRSRVYHG
jgi:hypothetical protein